MPIKIPDDLPARRHLESEGVVVMAETEAVRQDIRPLKIAILNLMPAKETTETHLTRVIGATPLQIEVSLITTGSYTPTNVAPEHLLSFYRTWEQVQDEKYDGLIVTGAPIETMPFEDVIYWPELTQIFDWTQSHVTETLNICWGGQASLYHFHGVPKHLLSQKMFGVYPHRVVTPNTDILRGFSDVFEIPVSRHTEVRAEEIPMDNGLQILAESDEAGVCLVRDDAHRQTNIFNHFEYDANTLAAEYHRDKQAGLEIELPKYYFPDNDETKPPANTWRGHGHLIFQNWINRIYQITPYEADKIGR